MPNLMQPLTARRWQPVADILFGAWLIARKDLAIEARSRELINTTVSGNSW